MLNEQKIMVMMVLNENQVAVIDDEFNSNKIIAIRIDEPVGTAESGDYRYDPDIGWVSINGIIPSNTTIQKLELMAQSDVEASAELENIRINNKTKSVEKPIIQNPPEDDTELDAWWYKKYMQWIQDSEMKLNNIGGSLLDVFSDYWATIDFGKDFIGIIPTNRIFVNQKKFRGMYIFRKEAHREFSEFDIEQGEPYQSYIPKLKRSNKLKQPLLLIRINANKADLGVMLRRDYHMINITQNLEQFSNYDELTDYIGQIAESLYRRKPFSD